MANYAMPMPFVRPFACFCMVALGLYTYAFFEHGTRSPTHQAAASPNSAAPRRSGRQQQVAVPVRSAQLKYPAFQKPNNYPVHPDAAPDNCCVVTRNTTAPYRTYIPARDRRQLSGPLASHRTVTYLPFAEAGRDLSPLLS